MKQQSAAQARKHASPDAAATDQAVRLQREFTSDKLDLITALNGDARINGHAFKVAVCIINHINHQTGYAFPSVETIADKTQLPKRQVERALTLLRATGWLRSQRVFDPRLRKTISRHYVLPDNVNAIFDEQIALTEARKAKREAVFEEGATRHGCRIGGGGNPTRVSDSNPTRVSDKHLRRNTSPSKRPPSENSVVEEDTGDEAGEPDAAKYYFVDAPFDPAAIPEPPPHQSIPDLVDDDDPDARAVRRAAIFAQARATLRDPEPEPDEDDLEPSYVPRPAIEQSDLDGEFEGAAS